MNIKKFNQAIDNAIKKMAEYSKKANKNTVEITIGNHVFLSYDDEDIHMNICLEIFDDEIVELYFELDED